ncbi:MAG: saccharopine dehydrogenase NADP-binding domain-containing protein [Bacteroidetes bacterium]|nr:saccharopine dehydrogenase NADP-binding domain-containing protein [Bacteroidota bacterium]
MKINKLVFIGCGSSGQGLLELWQTIENDLKNYKIIIIEPHEIPVEITEKYKDLIHLRARLTKENINLFFKENIDDKTFIINVSVDVDSLLLMKKAKEYKAMYIDSSIEDYEEDLKKDKPIEHKTLYYRGIQTEKHLKKIRSRNAKSILHSHAMNPGLISCFVLYWIDWYVNKYGDSKMKKHLTKREFGILSKQIGIDTIHISEIDTQETSKSYDSKIFYSTWSANGFQEEARDHVQIVGEENEYKKINGFQKSKIKPHTYYSTERGMDIEHDSYIFNDKLDVIKYQGMMIPHYEPFSLSEYLSYGEYCPNIYYVYKPCSIAEKSLDKLRKNNYELMSGYVLRGYDITLGYDAVGATIILKDKRLFWCGSILDINQTRKLGLKFTGPTCLQVVISMTRAIEYLLKHQNEGLITTESLNYKYMIDSCKSFLGQFVCKEMNIKLALEG